MRTPNSKLPEFVHVLPPYEHQESILAISQYRTYYGLLWEMGVGKTKPILDNIVKLFLEGELDGALIIAPKGAYMNWILNEIPTHISKEIPIRVAYWEADWNEKTRKAAFDQLTPKDDVLDILCMNVEALSTARACTWAHKFIKAHYTMMVIDESSKIKHHQSIRTKNAIKLGAIADYRRIMSGTPMSQSPLDIYSQCEFLSPGLFGHDSYTAFKNYYALVKYVQQGRRKYEKILAYRNLDEMTERLKVFTSRITKDECLDLPEKNFIDHYLEHTPEQAKAYNQIKTEALIMLEDEDMVSCTSVLTAMMKMHQINCGHMISDEGNIIHLKHNRCNELIELTELHGGKIIIWAYFRQDFINIQAALAEVYGAHSVVSYYGETTPLQRKVNLERFKNDPECRFMNASAAVAGMSLTLVHCHWNIYYSYSYDLEAWLQSQDRTHRIGQLKNVTYTVMQVPRTMDSKIIKRLKEKKHLADEVLDNWRLLLGADED